MRALLILTRLVLISSVLIISSIASSAISSGFSGVRRTNAALTSAFDHTVSGRITLKMGAKTTQSVRINSTTPDSLQSSERVLIIGRVGEPGSADLQLRIQSRLGVTYIPAAALEIDGDLYRVPLVGSDLSAPVLPDSIPVDDATQFPILPTVTSYAKTIYQTGLAMGNRPDVFTKIGDCMSADVELFLGKFGIHDDNPNNDYHLATYQYLQGLIDYYGKAPTHLSSKNANSSNATNSFLSHSEAAITGFNAASVEDPLWSDPKVCHEDETPLECEYRLSKPSVALIMFGTNDVADLSPEQFDFYLRLVIYDSIEKGVVPLLSTFPGDPYRKAKSHQFNQIIFQVARDYDVPVMNLWLSLQALPDHGLNPNSMYLSRMETTNTTDFSEANLQYGYTMRNLVTMQSLDILWRDLIRSGKP